MLQGNSDEALCILTDPNFGTNLKRWNAEKKIKVATRAIDFTKPDEATRALHSLVLQQPSLFHHDKVIGKTTWEICNKYYNKLASYVCKH